MPDITRKELNAAKDWYYKTYAKGERGIHSEFVDINPAMATILLDHNPSNRSISAATVEKYASDMKEKRWKPNGEAIILAKTGELNTGQHRLKAIIKSGVTVLTNLVYGADREDRYTIDTGRIQTSGDKATQMGLKYGSIGASIAGAVMAYEGTGATNISRISKMAILERLTGDERIQEVAAWVASHGPRLAGIKLPKKLAGMLFYRIADVDKTKATEFMEGLRSGANLAPNSPIFALRDRLMTRTNLNERDKMELFCRAWNLWIRGQPANILSVKGVIPDLKGPPHDAGKSA